MTAVRTRPTRGGAAAPAAPPRARKGGGPQRARTAPARTTTSRSTGSRSNAARSTGARSTTRTTARTPARTTGERRTPTRSSTGAARAGANRSRAVVRPSPQEGTGPRLRVLSRRRLSLRATMLLGAVLFFAVLAGSVAIQAERIEGQHEIDRLESETVAAIERNRSLRSQVAVAESPARIMDEARALEMVEPGTPVPLVTAGSQAPTDTVEGGTPEEPSVGSVSPDDAAVDADDAMTMAANDDGSEATR